ncbi:MAG: undecaprenyl/decaprenyl-phosphate alpha-N-acetylglucosaminyl 1-phosphate transferase [Patescibacteria group bacterium]|nr:undecaprenyl/decaprenyl-phosphate alpha-N-acetylglucosaminyl 1-phosphate transferase [Patescibacteria group bacterium]MCL5095242.1 undecaprenyl/decaprenyl-phosphate alpha-N-acetylglucosaminyl 1-phosphate transferase [Patescibacteria group bacterium]
MQSIFLLALGSALIISFCLTPFVIKLAFKFGLVDDPKRRYHPAHTHQGIIPRAGGLAIYLGLVFASLSFLPLNKVVVGILLSSTIIVTVGLWDDKVDLSPYFRFFTNFLAAAIVVGSGVGIPYITNPLGGILHLDTWRLTFNFLGQHSILVWADLFAIVWIVWCANMVNWSKGVDGQMPGFVVIAAATLGILALRFSAHDISQTTVTTLAFIVAGAFLGFLPWNFYPQKIMPGYGGGTLAGFLLAVLAILSWGKLGTAILVLGLPMLDAFYTLGRRLLTGHSPFWGDRGHLHHKLLDLGWGRRRIALFYWLLSAILGLFALTLNSQQKFFAFILLAVLVGGLILWLNFLSVLSKPPDQDNG